MAVVDILTEHRVSVAGFTEGEVETKSGALKRLASLLSIGSAPVTADEIERVLCEREKLQSTGVGGGVAIPHGALDRLDHLVGAVLLCPSPIQFDAIDGMPVSILFAVIGPKRATGEHLKTLARVARLFRDEGFRARLLDAATGADAYRLISAEEGRMT